MHKKDVNEKISLANSYAEGQYKINRAALNNKNTNDASKILIFDNRYYKNKYKEDELKNEHLKSQSEKITFHRYKTNILYQEDVLQPVSRDDEIFLTEYIIKKNGGINQKDFLFYIKKKMGKK